MGTLQNGNADVFRTIAAAVSKLKGLQLVLSIGNLLSRDEIGAVPNNAIVVNNAPQLELLKKASVCITHGGLNTVLEALTQGVPQEGDCQEKRPLLRGRPAGTGVWSDESKNEANRCCSLQKK